jgi:Flp pilus assembly protein TadD
MSPRADVSPRARTSARHQQRDVNPAAIAAYRRAAASLLDARRCEEAERLLREAVALDPHDADLINKLGSAIWDQGRVAEAEDYYVRARRLDPNDWTILNNLGAARWDLGRLDEAIECYTGALAIAPDSFDARMNLGVVLSDLGRFDEAMEWLRSALALRPDSADAIQNLGMTLARLGKWDQALEYYDRALENRPDYAEVHRNRAFAWLYRGDFERGWPEHEWRLKCRLHQGYVVKRPLWTGEELKGQFILLHYEQGLGDTLQFVRYAEVVKERGGRVVVLCQAPLLQVVARCRAVDLAFDGSTAYHPDCQVHAPLMSLPAILGTTLATVPARVPYLAVDRTVVDRWRCVFAGALGGEDCMGRQASDGSSTGDTGRPFLIGIAWQGSPSHRMDRWRSIPLSQFAPLAALPGVRLISLQTDHGHEQIPSVADRFPLVELPCQTRRPRDFLDTAAIMSQLDLVITPDTAVAHLAGGLGVPVWTALSTLAEWRWMADREDSPWYPSMRLFRQTRLGDWEGVFQQIAGALREELEAP